MLEYVKLAVHLPRVVRHRNDITIVYAPVVAALEQSRADGYLVFQREALKLAGTRASGHRFSERFESLASEFTYVPVTSQAHFRKGDNLDSGSCSFSRKVPNASKIVGLVARSVLELNRRYANVAQVRSLGRRLD